MARRTFYAVIIAASVVFGCVLSFYGPLEAAPRRAPEPFANAVQQRIEMINALKEITTLLKQQNTILKEQNALLRSGKVRVVVDNNPKQP